MQIGSVLLAEGLITAQQLEAATAEHRLSGERLDRVLVRMGALSPSDITGALSRQFHMPIVDLAGVVADPVVLEALPPKLVYKQNCVPIALENGRLTVATSDPFELGELDELRLLTGRAIDLVLADEDDLARYIRVNYGAASATLDEMGAGADASAQAAEASTEEFEQAQEASVIRLVNDVLAEAIAERATDVHIEPYEHELAVRYRIDGVLQRANVPPTIHRYAAAIVSRIKIMSNLNIAEKRRPQDGRITFRHRAPDRGVSEYDLRVSVIPMLNGEGIVLRVLSKTTALMALDDLGMPATLLRKWDHLIDLPHGIVLVTGPTGSGKSTTLYASLNRIVTDEIKAITVEDPVEYHVAGVNQIQVNTKVGLTFAAGLRSILRHDPDVVMVGEIRDKETAEVAVQASLTGHLVFSTLHTNDSAGATTRLLDMGIEPFLVASSVEGVLAQRLVRRICKHCAAPHVPEPSELPPGFSLAPGAALVSGTGCRECRNTGFRGRIGIYELLDVTEPVREQIMSRVSAPVIADTALTRGDLMQMRADGFEKARAGVTTLAEVLRAIKG